MIAKRTAPSTRRTVAPARAAIHDPWSFSEPGQRLKWPYDRWFSAHIRRRTRYDVVRRNWDQPLAVLIDRRRDPRLVATLRRLDGIGLGSLMELLDHVQTQETAKQVCKRARIAPADLVGLLRELYKLLPFGANMRQLIADDDTEAMAHLGAVKAAGLAFSLALLDAGCTSRGRHALAARLGIPEPVLLDLVHRADMSRLGLVSGGQVRALWAIGYRSLEQLQQADPDEMYDRLVRYYQRTSKGKAFDLTPNGAHSHIQRMKRQKGLVQP